MTEEEREKLRNHWISRALRTTREPWLRLADPMYLIIDAACLSAPLFGDNELWLARPTPGHKVGGVVRYEPGTKNKVLKAVLMDPKTRTATVVTVCEVAELIDNLGRLIEAIGADAREQEELLDKVRRWILFDDTHDDLPDAESWKQNEISRALATR